MWFELQLSQVTLYLKPGGKEAYDTTGLTLNLNGTNVSGGWSLLANTNLKEGKVSLSGNPVKKRTLNAGVDGLDKEKLDDIFILLKYIITAS